MTSFGQQIDQALGPSLIHFLEEISQLPQVMGIAQAMRAPQFAVGLPAVVNQCAEKPRQQAEGFKGFLTPVRGQPIQVSVAVARTCSH